MKNVHVFLKKYIALLIGSLKVNKEKRFAYSALSSSSIKEFGLAVADIRLGINELVDIKDIDFF